jgi:Reverse transcriptase (RNA-dependent DNA polymerase)
MINNIVLKGCRNILAPHITTLFRLSLDQGTCPALWKTSIILPLYKGKDPLDPNNYRPISLTCSLCRIFEKFLSEALLHYLMDNKLICKEQFGFVPKRSSTANLLCTLESWYDALYESKCIDTILVDFRKAFDMVPIKFLMHKLSSYGISGKILAWISDFLTNRTFRVKIGECTSAPYETLSGVPQGSGLGPILFLIYINDLPQIFPSNVQCRLFADDLKIYTIHKNCNNTQSLAYSLKLLTSWSEKWLMPINYDKTHIFYLGKNNNKFKYQINDLQLAEITEIKDLGITFDNKLNMNSHLTKIVKTAFFKSRKLLSIIKSKNPKTWGIIFKSYIRPLLEFSSEVWNPNLKYQSAKIEKVQRFYTRRALKKCNIR